MPFSNFYPSKEIQLYSPCGNFYNLITNSIKKFKINIFEDIDTENLKIDPSTYKNTPLLLDTSFYNEKIYLYFGITPVLLFYLPFNLITTLYLTDRLLVFLLSCISFLLSLFLVNSVTKNYKKVPFNLKILTIFLIGLCNLLPFIAINGLIYQVAVVTANILLLGAFCLFYYYTTDINTEIKNIFVFFISLSLCLAVGARPHYILFIPIFFSSIIYLNYKESTKINNIFKAILIFLTPCIIYGSILALYNYLRFDSIFEFGWKYQLNEHNQSVYMPTIKDFIIGLKNNFLLLPNINDSTFFSLTKASGHRIGNEYITGVLWICPIVAILIFIPNFLKKIYSENKKTFIFLLTFILTTAVSIIVASFFGMIIRYIFEFLSLMVILSVITFFHYINVTDDKLLKKFFYFLFILVFVFSVFMNTSLLFCKENFKIHNTLRKTYYTTVIKTLF